MSNKQYIISQSELGIGISATRYVAEKTILQTQPKEKDLGGNFKIDQTDNSKKPLYKSELGTPVFIDVTFGDRSNPTIYTDNNGNEQTISAMTFVSILCSVTFPRNIVKTIIQGRDGTVKEYIGEGDAQISFRGVITGKNGQYPIDEVWALKNLVKAPIPIPVISEYLNNLGIYTIVFEDRSFEQQEGGYSYQQFALNAISDTPQELLISGQ